MNSKKNGETWHPSLRSALEFKCYNWTLLWRRSSLCVCEAWSDFEFGAIFFIAQDCAAHCVASAFPSFMTNHFSFGIFKTFYFEQAVASGPLIFWIRIFYHDSLALAPANLIHQLQQVSFAFADSLLASLYCVIRICSKLFLDDLKPLWEFFLYEGCVKNHELDLFPPFRVWLISSHSWNNRLEIVAAGPELPIQSDVREFSFPFFRCKKLVAVSSKHRGAIPVASHAVKLLTH